MYDVGFEVPTAVIIKSRISWDKMLWELLTVNRRCLAYSSTLIMDPTFSSEKSFDFQRITRNYLPEERTGFQTTQCFSLPINNKLKPITTAERSKVQNIFAHSNTGIAGMNPTQDMDVCLRLCCICFVLCKQRPYDGLVLPSKESYQLSIILIISELILAGNSPNSLTRQCKKK
jgi:hypothetical protein